MPTSPRADTTEASPARSRAPLVAQAWARSQTVGPGMALAAVIALAATFVSQLHGGPQMLYALFFGTAFHYLAQEPKTKAGIEMCTRGVLRLGVGLLGARIAAGQIAAGPPR